MLLPEMIPIYIVNFNTTDLTNNCIKSIVDKLHAFDYHINVFDNSDVFKFELDPQFTDKVSIIDNTQGQVINFKRVCKENVNYYFYLQVFKMDRSRHGSLKHSYTINYLIGHEDKPFLLFDSDTELLKDIDFIDDSSITIAGICRQEPKWKNRFVPFIQYFNVPLIKKHHIKYFDKNRIMFGNNPKTAFTYDTGCSFYEDILKSGLPYKEICHEDYINHLCCGSWIAKNIRLREHYQKNYSK